LDLLLSLGSLILKAAITAVVAVPLGFAIYHFMYYRYTNREKIKQLVLEYLEYANLQFDQKECIRNREVLVKDSQVEVLQNELVYPSTKAIMKWVHCSEVVQKGIKKGLKYDEYFFDTIMGELMMEGRVSGIHDKKTDEIIAYKYQFKKFM